MHIYLLVQASMLIGWFVNIPSRALVRYLLLETFQLLLHPLFLSLLVGVCRGGVV